LPVEEVKKSFITTLNDMEITETHSFHLTKENIMMETDGQNEIMTTLSLPWSVESYRELLIKQADRELSGQSTVKKGFSGCYGPTCDTDSKNAETQALFDKVVSLSEAETKAKYPVSPASETLAKFDALSYENQERFVADRNRENTALTTFLETVWIDENAPLSGIIDDVPYNIIRTFTTRVINGQTVTIEDTSYIIGEPVKWEWPD